MGLINKLNELNPILLNCNRFSIYDYPSSYTITELLCEFFTKINECIDVSNKTIDLVQWLVDEGLKEEVAKKLDQWLKDGTLASLINDKLLGEINRKVTDLYVNVKNYGAKGDGETDDTNAIRLAVADMKKGTLFFPKGTYILSDEVLYNTDDLIIQGNNSIIKCVAPNAMFKSLNIVKSFKMKDIQFISTYQADYGVQLINVHHLILDNVWIQGFNKDGLYVEGCFISTFNNVTSIENKRYGANFDSDGVDPSNNNIRINNCNFSKNGEFNLMCKAHFVWDVNGLDCEQFDFIECNGERIYTKGSINIESAKVVSLDGIYYEAYTRDGNNNNFRPEYIGINLGTNDLAVESIKLDNFLIANNNNSRNGIKLTKVRNMVVGTGVFKGCLKAIQNIDPNNTLEISPSCTFISNSQDVDSDKKYFYTNKIHNFENIVSRCNIKKDNFILLKPNQNMYLNRLVIYYLESTNNYASNTLTLSVGDENLTINLLPNKSAPFMQVLNINKYVSNTDLIKVNISEQEQATGTINLILEKLNVY